MTIYEMFVQMWEIDYQMKLVGFDKAYFQERVRRGQLQPADYKKIVGEDYVAPAQSTPAQAQSHSTCLAWISNNPGEHCVAL